MIFVDTNVFMYAVGAPHPAASRRPEIDHAFTLVESCTREVWPVEPEDIRLAWALAESYPALSARDLVPVATCRRRDVTEVMTFDRRLASAFPG